MKRAFCIVLLLMLVLALLPVTGAGANRIDTLDSANSSSDITVYARISDQSQTAPSGETVYSVGLSWGTMTFDYTPVTTQTWSAETASGRPGFEETPSGGEWSFAPAASGLSANELRVENRSNADIQYRVTFSSDYPDLSGAVKARPLGDTGEPKPFGGSSRTLLDRSLNGDAPDKYTDMVYLTLSGTLPADVVRSGNTPAVGTLTVQIITN